MRTARKNRTFFGDTRQAQHDAYLEFIKSEFYEGDLTASARKNFVLTADKILTHPMGLIRMVSNTDISYRRTQQQIRRNHAGFHVLWFVTRGIVELVRSHSAYEIREGEWGIIDSNVPFHAKTLTEDGEFDVLYAVVPSHLYLSHLSVASNLKNPIPIDCVGGSLVQEQLRYLTELGKTLAAPVAEHLVASLLEALAEQVRYSTDCVSSRERIISSRQSEIFAYIAKHATDPSLTHSSVAEACGVSGRYLSHLMKLSETTFAQVLWDQRLSLTKNWIDTEADDVPFREIADRAGFKNVSHFSRSFKAKFGMTPSAYRQGRSTSKTPPHE